MASSSTVNSFDFNSIPEGCVASIIAFMTPRDACRLALVSRDFLSASESDVVWEQFLPSDCDLIVSRSDAGEALLTEFRKKKHLYMRLADHPLLVDANLKSFWLEKSSGKKCWMIGARNLSITWGDAPEYWKWTFIAESRFPEVAELVQVCWLDINVRIQTSTLSPGTQYAAYLVYKMSSNGYGFRDTVEASVHSTGGGIIPRRVYVTDEQYRRARAITLRVPFIEVSAEAGPNRRSDGWKEVKIGEFLTDSGEPEDEVELRVREVQALHWKSGLVVEGIEVRPAQE